MPAYGPTCPGRSARNLFWNELGSPDLDASSAFYSALFGWTVAPFEGSPEPYLSIKNGDANAGGIRPIRGTLAALASPNRPATPGAPPYWMVYFGVDDLDAALAKVGEFGGVKHAGPIDISIAKIAVVADPQGAVFALYDGELEP